MHINEIPATLLLTIMDPHPQSVNRVKDQLAMLNRELEKGDLDPKMEKYIKADIKALNEALDDLVDCSAGLDDPYIGQKFYNNACYPKTDFTTDGAYCPEGNTYKRYNSGENCCKSTNLLSDNLCCGNSSGQINDKDICTPSQSAEFTFIKEINTQSLYCLTEHKSDENKLSGDGDTLTCHGTYIIINPNDNPLVPEALNYSDNHNTPTGYKIEIELESNKLEYIQQ